MFKLKRGTILQEKVIGIIIFIIVAAIIIGLIIYENNSNKNIIDKETCHKSVLKRSNYFMRSGDFKPVDLFPLKCQAEEINIKTTNEEEIKKTIANAMYDCWWMLGEGKIDFFSEESFYDMTETPWGVNRVNCLICSTINFEDRVKKENIQVDLATFLQERKIPLKNLTYIDYFADGDADYFDESSNRMNGEQALKVSTNQDMMILYSSLKGPNVGRTMGQFVGGSVLASVVMFAAAGAGMGAIAGGVEAIPGALIMGVIGLVVGTTIGSAGGAAMVGANMINSVVRCETTSGCNTMMLVPATPEYLKACQKIQSIP
jgi:hypothetical protein